MLSKWWAMLQFVEWVENIIQVLGIFKNFSKSLQRLTKQVATFWSPFRCSRSMLHTYTAKFTWTDYFVKIITVQHFLNKDIPNKCSGGRLRVCDKNTKTVVWINLYNVCLFEQLMTPTLFFNYEKDQPHRFAFVSVYDSFIITIYFVANKDFTNIRRCILKRKKTKTKTKRALWQ